MIRRLFESIFNAAKRAGAAAISLFDGKRSLWRTAKLFALFILILGAGGLLVTASGIIPIKASSGHWAITRWFLQFSKQRSVDTHSLTLETPSLALEGLVLRGAGAYELNCRPCHGSPLLQNPRVAQAMTPRPPYLPHTIPQWESKELFFIVKHGIKFTGMPAWPSQQRDDEVWAMIAFLRRFPELDAEGYRQLVNIDTQEESPSFFDTMRPSVLKNCINCHGVDGLGRGAGAFPKLTRQSFDYIYASLHAYARAERHSGVMGPVAAALNEQEIREVSQYYAGLPSFSLTSLESNAAIERGESIAKVGIPSQKVPACASCHGPKEGSRNPVYPKLAGQYPEYLVQQLELFKNGARGGTAYSHLMSRVAANLTPEQMNDAALYYSSLTDGDSPQ